MSKIHEYIVVGSGPSGAMAAKTLVDAGKSVKLLDVGEKDEKYHKLVPDKDFISIRKEENEQEKYLLGDDFEAIPWDEVKVGAQLTPSRKAMIKNVEKLTPLLSDTFLPMESLAYGGLGTGWGLGSYVYSPKELEKAGLNPKEMLAAYQCIADRIGISVGDDDVTKFVVDGLQNLLPPLKMDNSLSKLYESYKKKKSSFNEKHLFMGSPPVAFLSEDFKGRKKTSYNDMDFYTDKEKAAYRSWITIDELKTKNNFQYKDKCLVLKFREVDGVVEISAKRTDTNEIEIIRCKKLLLATGALGTARIVLRSFEGKLSRLPVLCNSYAYMPCLYPKMARIPLDQRKTSMAQAIMIYDVDGKNDDLVTAVFFTYRSLLLFKLIKEAPLNFRDGRKIMQFLQSAFVIAGIHHPDTFSSEKYLEMRKSEDSFTGDILFAHYSLNDNEKLIIKTREKVIKESLRRLSCFPIKRMDPGHGSSIHYAGTLPFSENENELGKINPNGKLNGTSCVYVADGSGFTYLPAKGITLTLMANAHNVAKGLID